MSFADAFTNPPARTVNTPLNGWAATDLGNAERLVALHGEDIRYVPGAGMWFIWNGICWEEDSSGTIHERAKATVRSIYIEAAALTDSAARSKMSDHAVRSESVRSLRAMVTLAQTDRAVLKPLDEFDTDPWLFNADNGTVDLRTGILRPALREDYSTKASAVSYTAGARSKVWEDFVAWAMRGDLEMVGYLQKALGMSLSADVSERAFFILHGDGRNGKSTLLEAVRNILGSYGARVQTESLMKQGRGRAAGGATGDIARLRGARFVTANEGEDEQQLATARIKELAGGGDTITARYLFKGEFEFRPVLKLWFSTNFKPEVSASDQAIWDRLRLIPFEARISDADRDPQLPEKLAAEAAGILAWLVEGCLRWQAEGLAQPTVMAAAAEEYRESEDHIGAFFEDRLIVRKGTSSAVGHVRDTYTAWCAMHRIDPLTVKAFNVELRKRGLEQARNMKTREWKGAQVDPTCPQPDLRQGRNL